MSAPTPGSSPGFSGRRLLALVRKEGLQVMRNLARNLAWMLEQLKNGQAIGEQERTYKTSFIR